MKIIGILLFAMTLPALSEDVYAPNGRFLGEQIKPDDKIITPDGWVWQGMSIEYSPTRQDGFTHSTVFFSCVCTKTGRVYCSVFGRDNPNADGDAWRENWGQEAQVYSLGDGGVYNYQLRSSERNPHGDHSVILQLSEDGKRLISSLAVGKGVTDHVEYAIAEKVRATPGRWWEFMASWNAARDEQ